MTPTLRDGDRLLVRYGGHPRAGGLAVVRFSDGVVAVKRLDQLDNGDIQVARLFSADSSLPAKGYVILDDDKHIQPVGNVVPVVKTKLRLTIVIELSGFFRR